jgi:hypothetical protein
MVTSGRAAGKASDSFVFVLFVPLSPAGEDARLHPVLFLCHYPGDMTEGVFMRVLGVPALLTFVLLIALSGGAAAFVRVPLAHNEELVVEAILECGMFDGRFQCRATTGGTPHGKSAPGAVRRPPPAESPGPATGDAAPGAAAPDSGQAPAGAPADNAATCTNGMVGTPPNCSCPESSELLGGNCVHYTATCNNGLPANAPPQQCPKAEQKLACKARSDGLKDCCCITYDKF